MKERGQGRTRRRVQVDASAGDKTIQSFAPELDINRIVSKYLQTGEMPQKNLPVWGQTVPSTELQDQLETAAAVNQWFQAMPADQRLVFGNDPVKALAFLEHEENKAEAIERNMVAEEETTPPQAPDAGAEEAQGS